jgi:hypothetical protein
LKAVQLKFLIVIFRDFTAKTPLANPRSVLSRDTIGHPKAARGIKSGIQCSKTSLGWSGSEIRSAVFIFGPVLPFRALC